MYKSILSSLFLASFAVASPQDQKVVKKALKRDDAPKDVKRADGKGSCNVGDVKVS